MSEMKRKYDEFQELCKPVMEYLRDNHHPHKRVIITNDSAELVETNIRVIMPDDGSYG